MKATAIILSAGKGKRMQSKVSKQYMLYENRPLIYYTIKAFDESNVDDIVLVTGKDDIDYVNQEILGKYNFKKEIKIVIGGKERFDSSYNGILKAKDADIVLIHDGARPCVRKELINTLISETEKHNACIPAVPVKDTVKIADDQKRVKSTPDRKTLWQVQTPQVFKRDIIFNAYNKMREQNDIFVTDDSMVIEKYSEQKVYIVEGNYENIKVTTPEDMRVLELFIKK